MIIALAGHGTSVGYATTVAPEEKAKSRRWTAARFEGVGEACTTDPPFSFTFGGQSSGQLLKASNPARASRKLDDCRVEHTLTATDPQSGLVVRCVAVEYLDYPTVEWTVYFKNTGLPVTIAERPGAVVIVYQRVTL